MILRCELVFLQFFSFTVLTVLSLLPVSLLAETASLQVAKASYITVMRERTLDGVIEAVHQATLSAQTSGRVTKIYYDVDDFVEKNSMLLQFRDKDQKARFEGAMANYKQAQSEYTRIKDLHGKNLVSKSALDKAEANLKSTKAQHDQARENLENTRVRAPYSGIVVKRHIEVGETARVGQELFTGISLEQLRATVNVPESMINIVRKNKQARIILDSKQQSVAADSITISPYADAESHTFIVRVNLPPGDYHIYPGMFAKVAFAIEEQQQLVIPRAALVQRSEVSAVYVQDENRQWQFRQVRVGRELADDQVVILAGLRNGESVALQPLQAVLQLKESDSGGAQ